MYLVVVPPVGILSRASPASTVAHIVAIPLYHSNSAKCTKHQTILIMDTNKQSMKKNNKIDIDRIDDSSSLEILYILLYKHI